MKGKKLADTVIHILLVVFGIIFLISSQRSERGAVLGQGGDFVPKVCSIAWLLISVLLLIFGLREDEGEQEKPIQMKTYLATLFLLLLYVAALEVIGFVLCSVAYIFIQIMLFAPKEKRDKKNMILFAVIAVVVPVAVNLLFVNVFALILPTGIL